MTSSASSSTDLTAIYKQLHHLHTLALQASSISPSLSSFYVQQSRVLAYTYNIALHSSIYQRYCQQCNTIFIPNINCSIKPTYKNSNVVLLDDTKYNKQRKEHKFSGSSKHKSNKTKEKKRKQNVLNISYTCTVCAIRFSLL